MENKNPQSNTITELGIFPECKAFGAGDIRKCRLLDIEWAYRCDTCAACEQRVRFINRADGSGAFTYNTIHVRRAYAAPENSGCEPE